MVVAEDDGEVVGFGSLSPFRERPAYNGTVEDSVYVRGDQRGKGVGRLLVAELVDLAAQHGFHTVIARIVGGHDASIGLHRVARLRRDRHRARGRPQVRHLARRRRHAADALTDAGH